MFTALRVQQVGGRPGRVPKDLTSSPDMALSDEYVQQGQDAFLKATVDIILPRQQAAVWLELCRLRKKGHIPNWESCLLTAKSYNTLQMHLVWAATML